MEKNFKKGVVEVVPTTLDDLWHLYNIISRGDLVYARTSWETKIDSEYARPQKGKRVSVFMGIVAEEVAWDRSMNRLRVRGRICEAPDDIAGHGSHHTLNIAVNKPITIVKDKWLGHQVERLEKAGRFEAPPVIVISMDSEEYCIASIRQYGVEVHVEGKARLPGKLEADKRAEALQGYFRDALNALRRLWQTNRCSIVLIGVGFVKNQFANYMDSEAKEVAQALVDVKSVNSGGLPGIHEALRSGILDTTLKHIRVAEESRIVEEVLARLGQDKDNVAYGLEHVEKASSFGAVETILVTDFALRDASDEMRLVLERLMKEVEGKGGKVIVVSVEHEAGQKLQGLGGVAALLRFSIG